MFKKLYFVTGNALKAVEAQAILDLPIEIKKLDIEEIQDLSLEKVAEQKALDAFKILKKPLIVDDAGLYFDAWNGFPGPFIKFLLKSGGYELALRMMAGEKNRKVTGKAAVAFHDGKKVYVFIGTVDGIIPQAPQGEALKENWDSIFIPIGYEQSFAEMGMEKKNTVSHRGRALEKFKTFLIENNYD